MEDLLLQAKTWLADPWIRGATIVAGSIVAAFIANLFVGRVLFALTRKTKTDLDDRLVVILRRPIFISVFLLGCFWASQALKLKPTAAFFTYGTLKTLAVIVWATAFSRVGSAVLNTLSRHAGQVSFIQPRTLPLFEILVKVVVLGGAIYFAFLAWDINVTAWLASAGIVGIAVGFAAKDTLANLFAGIFILADAPYKLGDFVSSRRRAARQGHRHRHPLHPHPDPRRHRGHGAQRRDRQLQDHQRDRAARTRRSACG